MGYSLTTPASGKTAMSPKNCVRVFWGYSAISRPLDRRQSLQPRRKMRPTAAKPVSGIPYWPSRDPIGKRGGVNLYEFVSNDGLDKWDFLGLAGHWAQSPWTPGSLMWVDDAPPGSAELPDISGGLKDLWNWLCPPDRSCKVTWKGKWKCHETNYATPSTEPIPLPYGFVIPPIPSVDITMWDCTVTAKYAKDNGNCAGKHVGPGSTKYDVKSLSLFDLTGSDYEVTTEIP